MNKSKLSCRCGSVSIEVRGKPILSTICNCDDCQRASAALQELSGAPTILDKWGGTYYGLYRKDRVFLHDPKSAATELRIEGEEKTRRLYAACCNTPLFLDFEPGHWYSVYANLLSDSFPKPLARVQTKYLKGPGTPEDGVPMHSGFPFRMIFRLLAARLQMLFQSR